MSEKTDKEIDDYNKFVDGLAKVFNDNGWASEDVGKQIEYANIKDVIAEVLNRDGWATGHYVPIAKGDPNVIVYVSRVED